jgi:hypothetical protein
MEDLEKNRDSDTTLYGDGWVNPWDVSRPLASDPWSVASGGRNKNNPVL